MKKYDILSQIPENAVFWLLLFFLAAGSATSLFGKITGRTEAVSSGRVLSPIAVVSAEASSLSAAASSGPLSHVRTALPGAALTFDLSGGKGNLEQVLDTLDSSGATATFFVSRQWMNDYPQEVKTIAERGHELGIQAGTEINYRKLSSSEIKKELKALGKQMETLTGSQPACFRPPYGDPDNPCVSAASKLGYLVVTYDCDSLDWKDYGAESIAKQILNECRPESGSILMFHGNARYTAEALETVLAGLKESGLSAASVSRLLSGK